MHAGKVGDPLCFLSSCVPLSDISVILATLPNEFVKTDSFRC